LCSPPPAPFEAEAGIIKRGEQCKMLLFLCKNPPVRLGMRGKIGKKEGE